jgi:RNA polymerase sigma factor (sigma-70 family)
MKKDKSADLERAYRTNKKGLLAWATKATRSIADAEDLVQDAFATALANTESLVDVDDLAAWLFAALRNKARDLWRRRETRKRAGESEASDELFAEVIAAAGFEPEGLFETAELADALDEAIEELPVEQRAVIEAQVLDGFTFREIAEMFDVSPDTLAARKRYAVKKLAAALRDWYEE